MQLAVVIPLYNHERFIGDALRSVLAQTVRVDRIIVIDDGSTDQSAAVVRGFDDARIELVTQENAGAHAALNRGVAMAAEDCEWIAILNSDDVFGPARLGRCLEFLKEHPELDLVCTRLRMIDDAGVPLPPEDPKVKWLDRVWNARTSDLPKWLGIANFAKTSSNFVARSGYLRAHTFQPYRYVHDYYLVLDAALHHRLGVIDEDLLGYRTHATNTIKSGPRENLTREVLRLNLDMMRSLAPELAQSETLRADYTRYIRELLQNHGDFRAEVFVQSLAQLMAQTDEATLSEHVAGLRGVQFPELNAGKSSVLKEQDAQDEYEATVRRMAGSRWVALGRVLGCVPELPPAALSAEKRLALLKRSCAEAGWLQLGRSLGFGGIQRDRKARSDS